ncbi:MULTISPECIES: FAD/NAD(P)-binding protein [unclassified Neorhizobium]|uniref:FAD/NAD(P)-binding protein n=1 Tax=unclassified Neorhizobium TaxID=2629175 RepID=UPI001FF4F8E7|nr:MULTISPECIES: FAD/NAD(P)-binding protein [unclassified Neorhizobium]MCJ9669420.1 FAD/NAD(P)-binding protein [Neorhizobium sp. SHOUNA12B]MCJ9745555.1 FAD/NAD(P)-binding protein [Neorhizobium sp. SHOUNA12A]
MSKLELIPDLTPDYAKSVAVIGCGPTALYFLKHVVDNHSRGLSITFFSASDSLGSGMPYHRDWVGEQTLANIACEEIPDIETAPDEWLMGQSERWFAQNHMDSRPIGPGYIPTRHVLGEYFEAQFKAMLSNAAKVGITTRCLCQSTVTDVAPTKTGVSVAFRRGGGNETMEFESVVIATGHHWSGDDASRPRFMASPWPISKVMKAEGRNIGLIGTSLSAVDTCLALARKNGVFARDFDGRLKFLPNFDLHDFRIVMHSRRGLLPPVRVHFEHPRFEMYSYISQADIHTHIEQNDGHLSLDFLFERVLKTVLKEKSPEVHDIIAKMDFETFVGFLQKRRKARDPFELLREEYVISVASIRDRSPIYWKEVLDDITYTLNFHIRYLKPSDIMRVHNQLMPLLTYLVAVLPQQSCEQILALHEADCLSVVSIGNDLTILGGVDDEQASLVFRHPQTGQKTTLSYDFVVDCRGQQSIDLDDFPFQALVDAGVITAAKIKLEPEAANGGDEMAIGGVSVDECFHPISSAGTSMRSIFILAAPIISGIYPYHSGLPFCSEVAKIAARALDKEAASGWKQRFMARPAARRRLGVGA